MQEPKYLVTNEMGNIKLYLYSVDMEALRDVVRFKAEWPKARVPKEFWEEALMVFDRLDDALEKLKFVISG